MYWSETFNGETRAVRACFLLECVTFSWPFFADGVGHLPKLWYRWIGSSLRCTQGQCTPSVSFEVTGLFSTFLIIHPIPECDRRADSHRPFVSGVSPDVTPASCSPRDTIPKQWVKPYNTHSTCPRLWACCMFKVKMLIPF